MQVAVAVHLQMPQGNGVDPVSQGLAWGLSLEGRPST